MSYLEEFFKLFEELKKQNPNLKCKITSQRTGYYCSIFEEEFDYKYQCKKELGKGLDGYGHSVEEACELALKYK
jgi:hypothetical protein